MTRNKEDYAAAAAAVRTGTADRDQHDMNDRMARNAGSDGRAAREAQLAGAKAAQKK